jgi:hypothetical protein
MKNRQGITFKTAASLHAIPPVFYKQKLAAFEKTL